MSSSNATVIEQLQFTGNRLLMRGMKLALGILPLREPKLLVGTDALDQLADTIADRDRVAVPLADAEDNLQAIIALVTGRGGKVLLASEGLSPDPGPLADYNAMMAQTASAHDNVWYVDTAGILYAEQGPSWFLDDCHLTEAGHRLVA